jgi:hypothetical protein
MSTYSPSVCGQPNRHPARHLRFAGKEACVDEELADLVLMLWRLGINACCGQTTAATVLTAGMSG